MTAKEIEALPPEAFLDPELFVTEWDKLSPESDYAWEQYRTGLVTAHKYKQVVISIDGVWSANTPRVFAKLRENWLPFQHSSFASGPSRGNRRSHCVSVGERSFGQDNHQTTVLTP